LQRGGEGDGGARKDEHEIPDAANRSEAVYFEAISFIEVITILCAFTSTCIPSS